ncbi:uncharacterized protein I303_102206 [Kwoniella dejecticola CBS 10117]|uniref:Uncharacterized protein n=1 Tax=Kwoniella dejecticola CBS 10117 TaxID=1296121 RepID=A0A1A6ABN4_9TREE|nr:uncharacterized protein I303_01653 [Kwoniella dejecticola CBS 10117]OBR87448.1 hypothetical protein I303_01653 [Kwoniella dejecticola CBS 10117]
MSHIFTSHLRASRSLAPSCSRGLQTSSVALRKAQASQPTEEALDEVEDEVEDLFSSTPSSSSKYMLDKAAIRQANVATILKHAKLSPKEKKKDKVSIQSLRQVVACSEAEEAEQLKKVVRAWKVGGLKVSKATAREIVGRLCNIGKPEIASELISNNSHYGLPDLDQPTLLKLHQSLVSSSLPPPTLASSQPISPTLALLRLRLASQTEGLTPEGITSTLASSPKGRQWRPTKAVEAWAQEAREQLKSAGGVWADAAQKIQVS